MCKVRKKDWHHKKTIICPLPNPLPQGEGTYRPAFTLIETIMTLFVIGVVITASIMIFTGKHNATAVNDAAGIWQACENGQYSGLCTTTPVIINANNIINDIDRNKTFNTQSIDNNGNAILINNYYSLILGLNNNNGINDYLRSENSGIQVGESVIKINTATDAATNTTYNNFYISSLKNGNDWLFPSSTPDAAYTNNVVIGNTRGFGSLNGHDNVIIGNSNTITGVENTNTILGHNNNISGTSNNFIFGNSNNTLNGETPYNNNVIIGNSFTSPSSNSLLIGNGNIAANPEVQIGNNLYMSGNTLTFNDNVTINGQVHGVATVSSDIRLKNIKSGYKKGLNEILKLEPVNFYYNDDETATAHVGVIAQDLRKTFPEAIEKMNNGYFGVDSAPVFFAMINAFKEVNMQTLTEEQRTRELEKELKSLEKEINELSICKSNSIWNKIRCWVIGLFNRTKEVHDA